MKILFYSREKCKYGMALITDDESISEIFCRRYGCSEIPYEAQQEMQAEKCLAELCQEIQDKTGKKTVVFCYNSKERKAYSYEPTESAARVRDFSTEQEIKPIQLLENLLYTSLNPDDSVIALHGAAVAKEGRAYLLLASTTCGKSTLTAFLWKKAGFEYITDDEIFISRKSMCVEPVRKNLSLRQGGYDLLGGEVGKAHHVFDGKAHTYLIVPDDELKYPEYPIEKIIFLAGYGSDEPYFVKTEPREAFLKLLKGQLSGKNSDGNVIEKYKILTELSQKTYEMRYSDLWTAERYLRHLQK